MKLLVALVVLVATTAHAQVSFKGLALGADRTELLSKFPALQCRPLPPSKYNDKGDEICSGKSEMLQTYGGRPVYGFVFGVIAGHVESFESTIPFTSYPGIRDALIEANGPGVETLMSLATAGGRVVESRVWKAKTADGTITVYERLSSLVDGMVVGRSAAGEAFAAAVSAAHKGSKDL